ncbi:MAG: hypothetical protein J0H66_05370 [Solirubrobacterales bacterium]|nr:hypothetical protein [Solirubrobacterales bacterium]
MLGRKSLLWLAAAISVLTLTTVATANGATRERPCNGSVDLCSKTLDQVVLPGTHNSMSNEEYKWAIPNQHYSIPTQLNMGIRAFLIDTHYGKAGSGSVADWKAGTDGDPHEMGATVYLCHEYCPLGASDFTAELGKIKDYLAAHPREVISFMIENYVDPDDIAKSFDDSGLIDYVYTGSTDSYPTLSQMIDANQRVVVFSEGNTGSVSWFHNGYAGAVQETPYDFRKNEAGQTMTTQQGMDLLTNPSTLSSTCRPNRGGTTGSLFLMNHWVNGKLDNSNGITPDPAVAQVLNQPDVLVARARACEQRRGKLPNIVAVDDFGDGDLISAVRELNGVTAKPFFEVTKPKNAVVKSKKKATYKLQIQNWGDAESALTKVCATVPRKLAIKPKCKTVSVTQGDPGAGSVTLKIATRRIVKGKFKGSKSGLVKFTVAGAGDSVTTSARLKVNPLKKKKPKRKKHRR